MPRILLQKNKTVTTNRETKGRVSASSVDFYAGDRHTFPPPPIQRRRRARIEVAEDDGNRLSVKMTGKRVSYTLDSTLESVNTAEQTAHRMADKAGFAEDERHRISMAVREAAVNAVLHGNAYDPQKKMRVSFENTGDALVITIADEGHGLSECDVPDPLSPDNLLKQSGRGIFLIRSFMDEVRFRTLQPGTEITLIKHVRGPSADPTEAHK